MLPRILKNKFRRHEHCLNTVLMTVKKALRPHKCEFQLLLNGFSRIFLSITVFLILCSFWVFVYLVCFCIYVFMHQILTYLKVLRENWTELNLVMSQLCHISLSSFQFSYVALYEQRLLDDERLSGTGPPDLFAFGLSYRRWQACSVRLQKRQLVEHDREIAGAGDILLDNVVVSFETIWHSLSLSDAMTSNVVFIEWNKSLQCWTQLGITAQTQTVWSSVFYILHTARNRQKIHKNPLVQGDALRIYEKALRFLKLESSEQPTVKIWWF